MLRKDAKIELIKGVPLFESCSKRELREIASLADELDLPAGRNLTKEGATGYEFVVLAEGAAAVRRNGRRINRLGAGAFLGEVAHVPGRPRTATVTTTEPSRVLVITASSFRKLLRDAPAIQSKVLEAVARRLPED